MLEHCITFETWVRDNIFGCPPKMLSLTVRKEIYVYISLNLMVKRGWKFIFRFFDNFIFKGLTKKKMFHSIYVGCASSIKRYVIIQTISHKYQNLPVILTNSAYFHPTNYMFSSRIVQYLKLEKFKPTWNIKSLNL